MKDTIRRAMAIAVSAGHGVTQPMHLIAALLEKGQTNARRALESTGLTFDAVAALVRSDQLLAAWPAAPGESRTSLGPTMHQVSGWADGFAAATGTAADETTLLIATCWTSNFPLSIGPPAAVVAALEGLGVVLPQAPLPQRQAASAFVTIEVDPQDVRAMAAALRRRLPRDAIKYGGDPQSGVTAIKVLASELSERLLAECRAEISDSAGR